MPRTKKPIKIRAPAKILVGLRFKIPEIKLKVPKVKLTSKKK